MINKQTDKSNLKCNTSVDFTTKPKIIQVKPFFKSKKKANLQPSSHNNVLKYFSAVRQLGHGLRREGGLVEVIWVIGLKYVI